MRTTVTTLLDVLGLLLLAAGAAAAAWLLIGWTCLAVAGAVVLAGSWLVDRRADGGGGA
ncbi:hypothetical protein OG196_16295 [Kitasatospora purpeofusca]|uniref:hypothetical protein n=1 Tax=Kitasatospora purpeofusca TaxID=67352 RepID=UPI002E0E3FA3|nr:hypothetical protein OG196_16295 [Kitasatospora purpeofusca]